MFEASNVNQQIHGRVGPLSGSFTLISRIGVSIETIARAAQAVGKRVTFQLFDAESRGLTSGQKRSEAGAGNICNACGGTAQ